MSGSLRSRAKRALATALAAGLVGAVSAAGAEALSVSCPGAGCNITATSAPLMVEVFDGTTLVECEMWATGWFSATGGITIDNVAFANGDFLCTFTVATGLPWYGRFTSTSTFELTGVEILGPFSDCGPSDVRGALLSGLPVLSIFRFSFPGSLGTCYLSASLDVTPSTIRVLP